MKKLFQETHYMAFLVMVILAFVGFEISFFAGMGVLLVAFIYTSLMLD